MQVIYKNLNEIIPYDNNPRCNDDAVDAVVESIKQFGFLVPILIDCDNYIIAGHTRYKAAELLDITKVPCISADDLSDEQVKAFRLVDNKTSEHATWDFDKLKQELEDIEIDLSAFDFPDIEDALDITDDDFYSDELIAEKKPKTAKCPHCGEVFEI